MANQMNNIMDNVMDAQKQAVDTMMENTKKFTNGNTLVNEGLQKGSDWYKNWLDTQKQIFTKATDKTTAATDTMKNAGENANEFYQGWFTNQMNWAKQMWEMNLELFNKSRQAATNAATDTANPAGQWNNMMNNWTNTMNNWTNWTNAMNQGTNMFNQMQTLNPFNTDNYRKATENFNGLYNQYTEVMNNQFSNFQKNFQNGTTQDAFRNMVNLGEGFTQFYQMWMPMWKSIQDNTFTTDLYKQWMNPASYKDMMDKYFGFLPEQARNYYHQMSDNMQRAMQQATGAGMNQYHQFRGTMSQMFPMNSAMDMFQQGLNVYNNLYSQLQESVAPIAKMIAPNQYTRTIQEWNDIANRMMVFQVKNAEMQYMIYNQGTLVMDKLAESVATRIQNGTAPESMMSLYQEWLNIGDKVFVSLFESDTYSQLMAEVSATQLKLKKDIELQMEKFMTNIPVATRSEMDEMYKVIYDLKKQVRQLERMLEIDTQETATTATAATHTEANRNSVAHLHTAGATHTHTTDAAQDTKTTNTTNTNTTNGKSKK